MVYGDKTPNQRKVQLIDQIITKVNVGTMLMVTSGNREEDGLDRIEKAMNMLRRLQDEIAKENGD